MFLCIPGGPAIRLPIGPPGDVESDIELIPDVLAIFVPLGVWPPASEGEKSTQQMY